MVSQVHRIGRDWKTTFQKSSPTIIVKLIHWPLLYTAKICVARQYFTRHLLTSNYIIIIYKRMFTARVMLNIMCYQGNKILWCK